MGLPNRTNIRLKEYDYSQTGAYFVTICTKGRQQLLWRVGATFSRPQGELPLSNVGILVNNELKRLPTIYENVSIDRSVIMPNHVHMIIAISADNSGRSKTAPTVSRVIQQFKGSISKQAGFPVWQKSFYEHIIRNEQDYLEIWNYIDSTPLKWAEDNYFREVSL